MGNPSDQHPMIDQQVRFIKYNEFLHGVVKRVNRYTYTIEYHCAGRDKVVKERIATHKVVPYGHMCAPVWLRWKGVEGAYAIWPGVIFEEELHLMKMAEEWDYRPFMFLIQDECGGRLRDPSAVV